MRTDENEKYPVSVVAPTELGAEMTEQLNPQDNVTPDQPHEQEYGKRVTLIFDHADADYIPSRIKLGEAASTMMFGSIIALISPFRGHSPLATEGDP